MLTKDVYQQSGMQPPPQNVVGDFFRKFDSDGNGLIDMEEFLEFLYKFNQL